MTDEEEREQEIQEEFAKCKTFKDFKNLMSDWSTKTGYEEALALVTTAHEAFELAKHSDFLDWVTDEYSIRALKKCLELANLKQYDDADDNSIYGFMDDYDVAWFHLTVFMDGELVKMLSALHQLDLT